MNGENSAFDKSAQKNQRSNRWSGFKGAAAALALGLAATQESQAAAHPENNQDNKRIVEHHEASAREIGDLDLYSDEQLQQLSRHLSAESSRLDIRAKELIGVISEREGGENSHITNPESLKNIQELDHVSATQEYITRKFHLIRERYDKENTRLERRINDFKMQVEVLKGRINDTAQKMETLITGELPTTAGETEAKKETDRLLEKELDAKIRDLEGEKKILEERNKELSAISNRLGV